jgi:hypothetical protein
MISKIDWVFPYKNYIFLIFLNVQSGIVVRAVPKILITSRGQSSNPLSGTFKFCSIDIVKLDAFQLYTFRRSNKAVGVLVF